MLSVDLTQPTTIIAIYGAIVSTIVFFWNIRKDLRDRGRLSISVEMEIHFEPVETGFQKQPKTIILKVLNNGRRACTLQAVGLIHRPAFFGEIARRILACNPARGTSDNNALMQLSIAVEGLPKRLEYEEIWTGQFDWKSLYFIPYGEKVVFYAEDTLGNRAFTKRFKVDQFKDPDFEHEDELSCTIDDEFRQKLRPPQNQSR